MSKSVKQNQNKRAEKGRSFISGIYILTLSTVIVKIIGLIYKIPMLKLLGNMGMGYFNSAYEIYAAFCVISTAGLPVAMSLMVSSTEDVKKRSKIFRVALLSFFVIGVVCMAVILGAAYPFSIFLKSPDTYISLLCISPAIFFICLSSAARGYFQGLGEMKQTAFSQVIEAAGKLVFGLIFAGIGIRLGLSVRQIAGAAVLGLTLAEALSAAYLFLAKKRTDNLLKKSDNIPDSGKDTEDGVRIFKSLMKTTLPITLSASVLSITKLIDMTMIFRRLGSLGYGSDLVNSIYGSYTTLAIPLFSLAPALVSAIALPLVPAISSARAENDIESQNKIAKRALKLTSLLSAPIGAGLTVFSTPILNLIFAGENQAVAIASPLLSILGVSVLLSCLVTVQNAMLQAYEKPNLPIISMLIGSAAKMLLCFVLVGNPDINMYGIPVSTFVCDLIISAVNFYYLSKHSPIDFKFSDIIIKPYFCAIVSAALSFMLSRMAGEHLGGETAKTLLSICVTALLYIIMLFACRSLDKKEIDELLLKRKNTEEAEL